MTGDLSKLAQELIDGKNTQVLSDTSTQHATYRSFFLHLQSPAGQEDEAEREVTPGDHLERTTRSGQSAPSTERPRSTGSHPSSRYPRRKSRPQEDYRG
ncbi:unnamed protein product [Lota lota]